MAPAPADAPVLPQTATALAGPLLDPARLDGPGTHVATTPFAFLVATGQLPAEAAGVLRQDFPRYRGAGFFPWDPADCGPALNRLVAELTAGDFAGTLGRRLGRPDLAQHPTLVTLCRALNRRHGTIHTDSRSKVATALVYLEATWPSGAGGCLRFLYRVDDIDDCVVPEIAPVYGTVVAFLRSDNSFHGHLPHEGERRVIQVAWLTSEDEKKRKTRRGRFSRLLKKLLGGFDRHLGAGRSRNAAHRH